MIADYSRLDTVLLSLGYTDEHPEGALVRRGVLDVFHAIDALEAPENARKVIGDLVTSFVRGDVNEGIARGHWEPFYLGDVELGAVVRVKSDAYSSETGAVHNGLVGYFTSAYGRRCTIRYIGRNDVVDYVHPPDKLEVLKK